MTRPAQRQSAEIVATCTESPKSNWRQRSLVALKLLCGLRGHDFRAAKAFMAIKFPNGPLPLRLLRFCRWALEELFGRIPIALRQVKWCSEISQTPVWLTDDNPLANHPWSTNAQAGLPERVDTLVIGAGFTGASLAYHWAKAAPASRTLMIVEAEDPAAGASGRNAGTVVMGRYVAMVQDTLTKHWAIHRQHLPAEQREQLALQFAKVYAKAAYRNADLIEQTVVQESFDCDYVRAGWVQLRAPDEQQWLDRSVGIAEETGFTDWTSLSPDEVQAHSGARTTCRAGFSRRAATFHPAKWVWSLLTRALGSDHVQLFTRTRVLSVEDQGESYWVRTSRGDVQARYVVNATESYSAMLHARLHGIITPVQTQAAFAVGFPRELRPHVSLSSSVAFFERRERGTLFGSDETPLPDHQAGRNRPSRFISSFVLGELHRYFPAFRMQVTHEWSGTVGFTPDQYPIVGLLDNKRQYIIGGMCGSGTGVAFNAARCIVNRVLEREDVEDDYPPEYFAPSRLLDPEKHCWPKLEVFEQTLC